MDPIYLDYNATTPVAPEVAEAIWPFLAGGLAGGFGNPSSSHTFGRPPHLAVDDARARVARLLGCAPTEIVFTGFGSAADNLALVGAAAGHRERCHHPIHSHIEHPALL